MKKLVLLFVFLSVLLVPVVVSAQTDSPLPTPAPEPPPGPPPPSGDETLQLVLLWLIGGGGAGVAAYWLIEHVGWLSGLPSEKKRYASLGIAAGVACLAFVVAVALRYKPAPGDAQGWIEQLFAIAYLAVTAGQALHGRLKLRARL